ncbi:MAG TPA: DUF5985 family protein [Magnetospirillaceae bacterium]|jgi:hypothetical protein
MEYAWYPSDFMSGAIAMGYLVAAGFFVSFWRRTGDQLFFAFALAFALLTLGQLAHSVFGHVADGVVIYVIRLIAFLIIIGAIVSKNITYTDRDQR